MAPIIWIIEFILTTRTMLADRKRTAILNEIVPVLTYDEKTAIVLHNGPSLQDIGGSDVRIRRATVFHLICFPNISLIWPIIMHLLEARIHGSVYLVAKTMLHFPMANEPNDLGMVGMV